MQCGDTSLVVLVVVCVAVLARSTPSPAPSAPHSDVTIPRHQATPERDTMRDSPATRDSDAEDLQHLESSLLNMFGLSKRPRPKGPIQVPQHMIELYKIQAGITGDLDIETNRRTVKRHPGNTIRSFYSEDDTESTESHRNKRSTDGRADRPHSQEHHKVRLFFNVSQIPDHEALKGAELRVFRRKANDSFHNLIENQEQIEQLASSINKPHRIDIYEIIRPSTPTQESITRLIDTRYITDLSKSKWESFDIHPAVHRWRNRPQTNFGLEVHYTDHRRQKPALKHVRLRRSPEGAADADWYAEQPLLIAYSDDGKGAPSRGKRSAQDVADDDDNDVESPVNEAEMTEEERRAYRKAERRNQRQKAGKKRNRRKNQCKRHPLYVDFKDVGWSDWIIAPPGYDAYFCHGECPFYLPDHLNATNHAIVQTLVHSVDPQAAPSPCCVPTELSDIAMLYLDEFQKVTLKNYQDMVVLACGCR